MFVNQMLYRFFIAKGEVEVLDIILTLFLIVVSATIIAMIVAPIVMLISEFVIVPYANWWGDIFDKVENFIDKRRG